MICSANESIDVDFSYLTVICSKLHRCLIKVNLFYVKIGFDSFDSKYCLNKEAQDLVWNYIASIEKSLLDFESKIRKKGYINEKEKELQTKANELLQNIRSLNSEFTKFELFINFFEENVSLFFERLRCEKLYEQVWMDENFKEKFLLFNFYKKITTTDYKPDEQNMDFDENTRDYLDKIIVQNIEPLVEKLIKINTIFGNEYKAQLAVFYIKKQLY